MKKLVRLSFIIGLLALIPVCGFSRTFVAAYSVGLQTVESPADAKQQYGETKVVAFQEGDYSKYRYIDDYIDIVWYYTPTKFCFSITNKSNYSIKINWDDVSFVNCLGRADRVIHAGVKYSERNNSQPPTTIPKGASISDIILPADGVYYVSSMNALIAGWREKYLIPCVYKKKAELLSGGPTYVGRTMSVTMPIFIEDVQNDYTFIFSINEFLGTEK